MTRIEAERLAKKMNNLPNTSAIVVRILPESIDPVRPKDSGWDVQISHCPDLKVFEGQ